MKAAEPSFETEEKAKCSPCVVKVKRTKYLIGLLLVLLMLPTTLLFPSAELIARDCGNAENGEGCSSPGEYDVPSDFLPKINGPEEPNAVGAYDYLITGGCPPYKWEVVPNESKSTVSIDQNGRLQLTAGSCGSYTIKVTDGCGHGSLFAGKVGYNSQWVSIESCWDPNWIMAFAGTVHCLRERIQVRPECGQSMGRAGAICLRRFLSCCPNLLFGRGCPMRDDEIRVKMPKLSEEVLRKR